MSMVDDREAQRKKNKGETISFINCLIYKDCLLWSVLIRFLITIFGLKRPKIKEKYIENIFEMQK